MKPTSFFKHYRFGLLLVALIGLSLTDSTPSLAVGSEPPRPRLEDFVDTPVSAPPDGVEHLAVLEAATFVSWSRLAFQSYRDYNWEIYTSNDDGSGLLRLTNHPSVDIHPRLNRGGTRLVFASNRTDNYELFVMNSDGSGLTQLTATSTDDVYPAWSPDGTRLAFQSYRDGQAEIYVMNADGSGVTRLTFNTDNTNGNAYDAQPSWSPDGTRLAFISKRTGGYRVWVMNADGSGQTQLSNQPYSADPVWSPDGTRIAYDADNDGNEWQEFWLMNADGTNQAQMWGPAGQNDLWAGSWSPDSRYVGLTYISFVQIGGTWYWTRAVMYAWDTTNRSLYYLGNNGGDVEWSPDWQTLDALRPQSQVTPLPRYSRVVNPVIRWSGTDSGGSGLAAYDVQYRVGESSAWMDLAIDTPGTALGFVGTPGTTVYFRSQARDNAFNQETWPISPDGDTHTTFYTWQLDGNIQDVRNQPLAEAQVTGLPAPAVPVTTDSNGTFDAYMTISGTQILTVTKTGYASLLGEVFDLITDTQVSYWLPPTDNQLTNGSFETGNLTGWQSGGGIPVTIGLGHTGMFGGFMGQLLPARPPTNISYSLQDGAYPKFAFDPNGQIHVIWWNGFISRYEDGQIKYTVCSTDWVCQPAQVVASGIQFDIKVGSDGVVHLVWAELDGDIFYIQRPLTGTWSSPQLITYTQASYTTWPVIAVDPTGTPHVAWHPTSAGVLYSFRNPDGSWATPETVVNWGVFPDIAVEPNGNVHVVWSGGGSNTHGYNHRTPGVGWDTPIALSPPQAYAGPPSLAVDSQGTVHAVWLEGDVGQVPSEVHYAYRLASGDWYGGDVVDAGPASDVQVAVQSGDRVMLMWTGSFAGRTSLLYTYQRADASWAIPRSPFSDPQPGLGVNSGNLVADPGSARLVIGGTVYESFQSPSTEVYAVTLDFLPEQSDLAWLQQAVTVPAFLHQPTLGVTYQYHTEDSVENDWLRLMVTDANTTTPITLGVTSSSDWQHTWLDLSPWQGQTITVAVEISTTANDLYSWAYIDELTVDSWMTPMIETVSPAQVEDPTTLPITLTITGQNFIATPTVLIGQTPAQYVQWADATTLVAEVPASLSPGIYTIRVINPEGQAAVKFSAFILGKTTFFPLITK